MAGGAACFSGPSVETGLAVESRVSGGSSGEAVSRHPLRPALSVFAGGWRFLHSAFLYAGVLYGSILVGRFMGRLLGKDYPRSHYPLGRYPQRRTCLPPGPWIWCAPNAPLTSQLASPSRPREEPRGRDGAWHDVRAPSDAADFVPIHAQRSRWLGSRNDIIDLRSAFPRSGDRCGAALRPAIFRFRGAAGERSGRLC